MDQSLSEIRKAENEVVFRSRNKQAIRRVAETKRVAAEENQEEQIGGIEDTRLFFYCECVNDKCRERIELSIKEYEEARKNSSQFVLVPGHHSADIERIVFDHGKYIVVQKYMTPPSKVKKLNPI